MYIRSLGIRQSQAEMSGMFLIVDNVKYDY